MTPSDQMFSELRWLSFPQRLCYHTCIMMYKALYNMAPEYIQNLFQKMSDSHNRNLLSVYSELLRGSILTNQLLCKCLLDYRHTRMELFTLRTKNNRYSSTFQIICQNLFSEQSISIQTFEPPRDKTKNVSVRPAETQVSLGIRPDWSESSLCAQWVA